MNLHAVYYSPTKTTKAVVETICNGIGEIPTTHDITLPSSRQETLELDPDDCLILGLPVYAGRIPEMTEAYLRRLKGQSTPAILVAVYGNRDFDDALLEMKDILDEQGFITVAAGAFIGEHSYTPNVATNRPDSMDLSKCEAFGVKVKELVNKKSFNTLDLSISGNRPYRDRPSPAPVGPTVDEGCVKCGTCVNNCPTGSLCLESKIEVDETLCVRCHACTRNCPVNAIEFDNRIAHIKKWLENSFSERKEPEVFFSTST